MKTTVTTEVTEKDSKPAIVRKRATIRSRAAIPAATTSKKRRSKEAAATTATTKKKEAKPEALASELETTAKEEKRRGILVPLIAFVGVAALLILFFFLAKGAIDYAGEKMDRIATGTGDSVTRQIKSAVQIEGDSSRRVVFEKIDGFKSSIDSLDRKLNKVSADILATTDDLSKKSVAMRKEMGDLSNRIEEGLARAERVSSERSDRILERTNDGIVALSKKIEEKVKPENVPEPTVPIVTQQSRYATDSSDTHTIIVSRTKTPRYDGWEIMPGEMSQKFCIEDVSQGKIEISRKPGIIARNHLKGWRYGWIDTPVPETGSFVVSSSTGYVSFYSPTEHFTVKKMKL